MALGGSERNMSRSQAAWANSACCAYQCLLGKGIRLFAAIVIPFAVYRFLAMHTLQEMQPFIIWVTQVFLFFSLLGLLAVEYRLLRKHSVGLDKLRLIHDLPTLSVYGSSLIAAVIPAIVAILSNRISEIMTFFIQMILPVPLGK